MKKILFILLMVLIAGCEGELMEGVGGDAATTEESLPEPSPTLAQKMRGIWIIGGAANQNGTGIYSEIDLYDPLTDTWYPDVTANASGAYVPVIFSASAYVDGKIYVIGGAVNSSSIANAVYEYDIENNTWATKEPVPINLHGSAVYTFDDYCYLIGGSTTNLSTGVTTNHYRFDPSSGTLGAWTALAVITTARSHIGAFSNNGIVSYFGGRISGTGSSAVNYIYAIASNTANLAQTAITSRGGCAYSGYAGQNGYRVFIIGGAGTFSTNNYFTGIPSVYVAAANSFQIFTPPHAAGGLWNGKAHPAFSGATTTGIVYSSAVVSKYAAGDNNSPTLYVFGGIKNQTIVSNEIWTIPADLPVSTYSGQDWTTMTTVMPRVRFGHSAVKAGE